VRLRYHANHLPNELVDYIFSSHCLEHVDDWVTTLEYWMDHIRPGGILFLYLPHISQKYWRPWFNRKHRHVFTQEIIVQFFKDHGWTFLFQSGTDLNHFFMIVTEKPR